MRLAVTAAAAALLAVPAAAGATPRPSIAEFGVRLDGAAHAASGPHRALVRPGRRFDLVGARWRGAGRLEGARLRVRVSGRWRRWVPLPTADGPAHGSDPVWTGGADALQLRWRRAPAGLRLRFVRITHRPRPTPRARPAQAGGAPPMVPRSEWDPANQCRPRSSPQLGTVQMAFVHHTVSANDYTADQTPAMVLAICRYHRDSNGWNDIGYNFLVDKYGRLFEGRAGGIDQPIVGAQAQGWNSQSTSVSNLGTYSDVPQTDAALQAMARLLAWKLPLHGAPVTGTVTLTSGGGSENRYPAGRRVTFERISGHRDGGRTECPGDALYAQLPRLRDLAARAVGTAPAPPPASGAGAPAVTMSVINRSLLYPEPLRLTGTVSGGGELRVQVSVGENFVTAMRTSPHPDGSWTAELPMTRGHRVRVLQILPDGRRGAVSEPVAVSLTPALSARAPRRVLAGRSIPVRGTIAPRQSRVSAVLSFQGRSGRMHYVRRVWLRASRSGAFRGRLRVRRPALYRVRVTFRGSRTARRARAGDLWVRAVRHRSSLSGGAAGPRR